MLNDKDTPPGRNWTPQQVRDYELVQVMRMVGAKPDVIHWKVEVKQDEEKPSG